MTACATTADCAEVTTGCCMSYIVDSVAEDSVWGDYPAVEVGPTPGMCETAEW